MPPPLSVHWPSVHALALQIGVREAARQFGISEEAALKRSQRESWIVDRPSSVPLPTSIRPTEKKDENGRVLTVLTGPKATANVLRELGEKTRIGLAKGLAKGAAHVEQLDGEEVLMNAKNIASLTKSASDVHGWSAAGPATISFRVGLLGAASEKHVDAVEIESQVEQIEDCGDDEE